MRSRLGLQPIGQSGFRTGAQRQGQGRDLGLTPTSTSASARARAAGLQVLAAEMNAVRIYDGDVEGRFEMAYRNGTPVYLGAFFGDRTDGTDRNARRHHSTERHGERLAFADFRWDGFPDEWGSDWQNEFYLPTRTSGTPYVAMASPGNNVDPGTEESLARPVVGVFGRRSLSVRAETGTARYSGYGRFHVYDAGPEVLALERASHGGSGTPYEGTMTSEVDFRPGARTISYRSDRTLRHRTHHGDPEVRALGGISPVNVYGIDVSGSGTFDQDGEIGGTFTATPVCTPEPCGRDIRHATPRPPGPPIQGRTKGNFYGPENQNLGITFRTDAVPVRMGPATNAAGHRLTRCVLVSDPGRTCPAAIAGGAIFTRD